MKNTTLILAVIVGLCASLQLSAQENVPKEVLLNTMNSVNRLKLSNLKTSELMKYNKIYVDKVYRVLESGKSDNEQKSDLKALANDREKDLTDLIGKSTTRKYAHLMDKEMRLLVHKNRLLRYIY
ncbi:hypothetical protein [Lutimonas vermicola]|uniref:Uncharacterized protein n=1 Tax=Lutimonas vermicola TaxID=414288 RepID=A0ABU9KWA4_9FLAO